MRKTDRNALLFRCMAERVAYETARAASGRSVSMKWLGAARYKAETAGFSLEEIDAAELAALESTRKEGTR